MNLNYFIRAQTQKLNNCNLEFGGRQTCIADYYWLRRKSKVNKVMRNKIPYWK